MPLIWKVPLLTLKKRNRNDRSRLHLGRCPLDLSDGKKLANLARQLRQKQLLERHSNLSPTLHPTCILLHSIRSRTCSMLEVRARTRCASLIGKLGTLSPWLAIYRSLYYAGRQLTDRECLRSALLIQKSAFSTFPPNRDPFDSKIYLFKLS